MTDVVHLPTPGYGFTLTCPACAGPVTKINQAQPLPNRTCTILHCTECNREMSLTIDLVLGAPHGTTSTYQRHITEGEQPCDACKQARNAYQLAYRNRNREMVPA